MSSRVNWVWLLSLINYSSITKKQFPKMCLLPSLSHHCITDVMYCVCVCVWVCPSCVLACMCACRVRTYEGAATLLHGMDSFTHPDLMADNVEGGLFLNVHALTLTGYKIESETPARHFLCSLKAWQQLQAIIKLLLYYRAFCSATTMEVDAG